MREELTYVEARALSSRLKYGLVLHHTRLVGERLLPVVKCSTSTHSGFGEAPPLPTFTGESAKDTVRQVDKFAAKLLGRTPRDALELVHASDDHLSSPAQAALDIALHDLIAKHCNQPVQALLGNPATKRIRISRAIGLHPLERTVELARGYVSGGVTALKLKVGRDTGTDAAVIQAVRDSVGHAIELSVDANAGLSVRDAQKLVDSSVNARLAYFEQPVSRYDYNGLKAIRDTGIPVLVDESLFIAEDAWRLLEAEAADIFAIKLIKCGGLRPALDIVEIANAQGVPVVIIDPLGSAVSLNAGLHLAATLKHHPFAHGLSASLDVTTDYAPHLPIQNGHIEVPNTPGLGVEVAWPGSGEGFPA